MISTDIQPHRGRAVMMPSSAGSLGGKHQRAYHLGIPIIVIAL